MRKRDWSASWVSSGSWAAGGDDSRVMVIGVAECGWAGGSSTRRKVGRFGKISASLRGSGSERSSGCDAGAGGS